MLLQFLQRARIEEGIFLFFIFPPFLFVYSFLAPFFLLIMLVAKLPRLFVRERARELITSMTYSLLLARKQPWKCSLV